MIAALKYLNVTVSPLYEMERAPRRYGERAPMQCTVRAARVQRRTATEHCAHGERKAGTRMSQMAQMKNCSSPYFPSAHSAESFLRFRVLRASVLNHTSVDTLPR